MKISQLEEQCSNLKNNLDVVREQTKIRMCNWVAKWITDNVQNGTDTRLQFKEMHEAMKDEVFGE